MDIYSFSSTFDSRPSARSSTSSIGNWAPRARSSSVSSQGSTGSVNLDAIIASESDLNEEKPLELVEGDEVDWTNREERPAVENAQPSPTPLMANSYSTTPRTTHLEDQGEDYWAGSISENEIGDDEDDEEFGEALREFSQMSLKTNSSVQVRGLGFSSGLPSSSRIAAPSSRFPPKKNPFDLDADYMDPVGLDNLRSGSRTSTYSNSGTASNRSSISKMPTPSGLVQPKSGKAPGASRLAQPGARSMVQPKPTGSRGTTPAGQAPKSGQVPRGLQAPRTGLQAPKTQAPRASTATRAPTKPGVAPPPRTGPSSLVKPQVKPGSRLTPPSAPASRINTTRSQLAPPATIKRPNIPTSTSNRTSLLQAPASMACRSTGTVGATVARMNAAAASSNISGLTSPKRSLTMPSGLVSPTRIRTGGSAMVSPTSSQSSTSSLPSLGYGARDSSQRLMNATGAASSTKSRLMGPRIATGRTSMYGSSAHLRMEEDEDDTYYDDYRHPDYAVLTPPQSPSAKGSRLSMVPPTRLAIPTTMTSRIGRPSSPATMGVTGLRGPQVHGLVSPKAGHHRY
ncbi:hypothetical protein BGZ93_001955 [Podila epicladia]|nr:hypothetical protein BGZ93_001955 [Podila epicladia]